MDYSEEQIKDVLELKEWISEEIEKHQKDIEKLEKNLVILDSVIKQSSFSKASSFISKNTQNATPLSNKTLIPIKRSTDNKIIANAYVTPDEVVIIPSEDIILDTETHPFKSFFLGRIIGGMENKDNLEVRNGKISEDAVINCMINKDGSKIREILIKNYRERERVNEIINTASWSFSRMIENSEK
jgi:hypothetical protein